MAALITSDFEIPAEVSTGIFEKAQKGSTLVWQGYRSRCA